jgi:hypothetical protein
MNFDDAIKAHAGWKVKLSVYLKNPNKSIDHNDVCKDNICDLGKWIYGEGGAKYSADENFKKLKQAHTEFHQEAASIIKKADANQNVSEEIALGNKSKFITLSNDIVTLLMGMKRNENK